MTSDSLWHRWRMLLRHRPYEPRRASLAGIVETTGLGRGGMLGSGWTHAPYLGPR